MTRTTLITGFLFVLVCQQGQPAAQEPGPVTLTLRLAGDRRQFRPGEVIPIELVFESNVPKRFAVDGGTYDRSGRLTIDEFRLSPTALVTDPMLDYFASAGGAFIGGGLRGTGTLGENPYTVALQLNDWFRFDTPGTLTLLVRTNRVTDEANRKPGSQPTLPVESTAVTFEILPRDTGWENAEVERARQILAGPRRMDWRGACRTLRYLGTPTAVDEMVRRYDDDECRFDFLAGLFGAPDRAYVVQQLETRLRAPDQVVTRSYLQTLSVLSLYLRQPELRPAQTAEAKGRFNPGSGELARRPELVQKETERYLQLFEAALPLKVGTARAVSIAEHAEIVRSRPASASAGSVDPAAARQQLIAAFSELPASRQETLIRFQWRTIADPNLVPALRQLSGGSTPLADLALRRLYQLAPDEGRARIVDTISRLQPGSTLQTLGALPDATIPELDDAIARNVEASITTNVAAINVAMLHRYASPAVAPRMLARVVPALGQLFDCAPQAAMLAYFLRVRPPDGADLLDRALAARGRTTCYQRVLLDTAQLRMTPELERRAIAALEDEHPRVVQSAIDTLGRFGSPAAIPVLRAHFERWNREWRDRADALRYNPALGRVDDASAANGMIEVAYLRALATAPGWLTSTDDIEAVRAWCVTENCRIQANMLVSESRNNTTTIDIFRLDGATDVSGRVAQYDVNSLAALGAKLAQYPKGTVFTLRVPGNAEATRSVAAEVTAWASAQGFAVRP